MKIVLLSGGSGKRLWPLSNEIRSKQFLKVVKSENNEMESMVQRVYRQLTSVTDTKITIATSASQVESIKNQLGEKVSLVVEPERRNTFPAIALSSAYLRFEKDCPLEETVIVLPVDPYVDNEYFGMLKILNEAVQNNAADIVLMGVKPTYPSEKYGYIIPESTDKSVNPVREFREKPDAKTAEKYIAEGALWNCGVFAFKLSYLMNIVDSIVKCGNFNDVKNNYRVFEKKALTTPSLKKQTRLR